MENLTRRDFGKTAAMGAVAGAGLLATLEMEGCSASWIQTAINDLPIVVEIADSILGIVAAATGNGTLDQAGAAAISAIATAVKAGLATLQNLIKSYQSNQQPGVLNDIIDALNALQTNLSQILQTVHISNPALQTTISTAVGLAIATVSAIQLLIPQTVTPSAQTSMKVATLSPKASQVKGTTKSFKLPDHDNLRTMYNAVAVMNGFSAQQI